MKTETENSGPQPPVLSNIMNVLLEATGDLDSAEALQKSLPDILLKGSASTLIALDQTARDLYTVQLKVEEDLRQLKPLHDFCISELTNALSSRWPAVFDVEKDLFSLPGYECGCSPTSTDEAGIETYPHITQTLLQAAM
ncbi:hypothetical protein LS633_01790 [Pseudomonas sp. NIBR-H-19]|nr:hypothetical protein [Pseudomonas sp. NIBR-H-19]UHC82594.1 hypothetical protein LS633_01790 [Pseudomonas sp. NIBR-H-19]